jgi:hypothetical protein
LHPTGTAPRPQRPRGCGPTSFPDVAVDGYAAVTPSGYL